MGTLGSDSGIQSFLESLTELYVEACNIVFLYNPRVAATRPADLAVEIDEKYCAVNEAHSHRLFKQYWNEACGSSHLNARISGEVTMGEWRWVLSPLMQSCRQALATVLREQLDADQIPDTSDQVEDISDAAKAYFCSGAIWRSVLTKFVRNDRVKSGFSWRACVRACVRVCVCACACVRACMCV